MEINWVEKWRQSFFWFLKIDVDFIKLDLTSRLSALTVTIYDATHICCQLGFKNHGSEVGSQSVSPMMLSYQDFLVCNFYYNFHHIFSIWKVYNIWKININVIIRFWNIRLWFLLFLTWNLNDVAILFYFKFNYHTFFVLFFSFFLCFY